MKINASSIIVAIVFLILGSVIGYEFLGITDPLVWLTSVLAAATTAYAWTTWLLVLETRKSREFEAEKLKMERRPEIFATFENYSGSDLCLHCANVGKMPAKEIAVTYHGTKTDSLRTELGGMTIPSLGSGEKVAFIDLKIPINEIDSYEYIDVDIDIKDMYGYPSHQVCQRIPSKWVKQSITRIVRIDNLHDFIMEQK